MTLGLNNSTPSPGAQNVAVVLIDDVDLPNRIVHARDKTNVLFQISFRATEAGILRVPEPGEKWTAVRIGWQWYLDKKLTNTPEQTWINENMGVGDSLIDANTLYATVSSFILSGLPLGASVYDALTTDGTTASYTLHRQPVAAETIQAFINGLLIDPRLYSLSGSTITFQDVPHAGTLIVYYQTLSNTLSDAATVKGQAVISGSEFRTGFVQAVSTSESNAIVNLTLSRVAAGDALVVVDMVATGAIQITAITDTQNNTWVLGEQFADPDGDICTSIWYALNAAAGDTTLSIKLGDGTGASARANSMIALELAGIATSGALVGNNAQHNSAGTTGTAPSLTPTADAIVVSALATYAAETFTTANGFVSEKIEGIDTVTYIGVAIKEVASGVASNAPVWTLNTSLHSSGIAIALKIL